MRTYSDKTKILTLMSMISIVTLLAGCTGDGKGLTKVSGTVKAKGKLVSAGEVMFYPAGGGRPAIGQIDPEGKYQLTSFKLGDGVVAGAHKVTISAYITRRPNNAPAPNNINEETVANMAEAKMIWLIPQKYSELRTTTLTADVELGSPLEINFDSAEFE